MHFLSINAHSCWRADAQANPVTFNGGHDDPNLVVDDDLFTDPPSEHQHGFVSVIPGKAAFVVGPHAHCLVNAKLAPRLAQSGRTAMSCGEPRGGRCRETPDAIRLRRMTASQPAARVRQDKMEPGK